MLAGEEVGGGGKTKKISMNIGENVLITVIWYCERGYCISLWGEGSMRQCLGFTSNSIFLSFSSEVKPKVCLPHLAAFLQLLTSFFTQ